MGHALVRKKKKKESDGVLIYCGMVQVQNVECPASTISVGVAGCILFRTFPTKIGESITGEYQYSGNLLLQLQTTLKQTRFSRRLDSVRYVHERHCIR